MISGLERVNEPTVADAENVTVPTVVLPFMIVNVVVAVAGVVAFAYELDGEAVNVEPLVKGRGSRLSASLEVP